MAASFGAAIRIDEINDMNTIRSGEPLSSLAVAILALLTIGHAGKASAATVPATNCNDGGYGSLRSAVASAASGDTVDLRGLRCSAITLVNGPIAIAQTDLTLVGPGRALAVSGNHSSSVFRHSGKGVLRIEHLTVAYGLEQADNQEAQGGCIYSTGSVELDHVKVHSCSAVGSGHFGSGWGGGIYAVRNVRLLHSFVDSSEAHGTYEGESPSISAGGGVVAGNLWVDHSTICHNRSGTNFGGAFVRGSLHLVYSSVTDNYARGSAAAFQVNWSAWILHSTIAGNYARDGGIANFAGDARTRLMVVDSTITNNSAESLSGLLISNPSAVLVNNTIAFNHERFENSSTCGGALNWVGTIHLESTIVARNTCGKLPVDINVSSFIDGDNNLVMASNAFVLPPGTIISADPRLAPLANNGGPTKTRGLMSGSPAIDAGNNAAGLDYDQRGPGFPRVKGLRADIGAVER